MLLNQLLAGEAAGPALTNARRRKIMAAVSSLAGLLLEAGPNADISAISTGTAVVSHTNLHQAELAAPEAAFDHMLSDDALAAPGRPGGGGQRLDAGRRHTAALPGRHHARRRAVA